MKNVSLYIARRYNTHTLLISMILIAITALLIGSILYIGNSVSKIFSALLYHQNIVSLGQQLTVYGMSALYIVVLSLMVFFGLRKLLQSTNRKTTLLASLFIALVFGGIAAVLLYNESNTFSLYTLLLVSLIGIGLIALVFGLLTYLLAQRKITGVNIITSIAVFAITIATCALFIILSVFSGLEKMNIQFFSNVNPDLKISPSKGKAIPSIDSITAILDKNAQIFAYAKVIEEKVSIEFDDKQDIAYIKGIDKNYTKVVRIDTTVVHGTFLNFETPYQLLASDGVARRLQMYIDQQSTARLRMPKPGTGLISSEEEAFNAADASPVGIVFINDQYDKYLFSPLGLTQKLLQLPENAAYSLEIKLKPGFSQNSAKDLLQKELGQTVKVQTRSDLDATFLKVMNVENLIIYLIFTLVIIIASFNLAGAIIIIIIDKKMQIKSMWSFGMERSQIKKIFFQTGLLITLFSIMFGLLLGSAIGAMQNKFHLVMANAFVPFPFEFTLANYFIVFATVLVIGGGVSFLVSRKLPI